MSFEVPYSSSPPSTPDRRSNNGSNGFSFGASNPSTTPAGPPPSSAGSFTPAGPPPSSIFGSSMMDNKSPIKPLSFSRQSALGNNSPSVGFARSSAVPPRSGLSHRYNANESEEGEGEEYMDEEEDQEGDTNQRYTEEDLDTMEDDDGSYEDDEDMDDYESELPRRNNVSESEGDSPDLLLSTPGALKRSRGETTLGMNDSFAQSMSEPKVSIFETIAKGLYTRMPAPVVNEADDLILDTETIITQLYDDSIGPADEDDQLNQALAVIPSELMKVWEEYHNKTTVPGSEEYTATIGPGLRASDFAKANFLAGLTLQIQHPEKISKSFDRKVKALPQTLLEWMDEYHNPYPSQFAEIQSHSPSPSNHRLFWSTIFNSLIRGKIVAVVNVLKEAGWQFARNDTEAPRAPFASLGFSGVALSNIERVANAAIYVLSQCPAFKGDWNIRNSDWTLFRLKISSALDELRSFAEGRSRDNNASESIGRSGTYSKTAQKAESKVPWHIYQNLVTLYSIVIGDVSAIIENSEDWLEATIGLLVWWDEGKDDRRLALGRSQNAYRAASRETDENAFRRKLRRSFETATADSTDFEVNSADEIEVALASLFEGDYVSVIGFLRGWSGPVSSAVAEVASAGGWLPQVEEKSLINMGSLDQDDMDLLGLNASPSKADGVKDQTLIAYARSLTRKGELRSTRSGEPHLVREGWEISIALLGRLDSVERSEEMVGTFLEGFDLESSSTVDKLWTLLNNIGMTRHAEMITDAYANSLAEGSHKYGEALWYYALSHKNQKVKDVLDLLISFSLVQSTAYPPEAELDHYLEKLIGDPTTALTKLSHMDNDAAELLHKMLSGYATLRKFYNLRDAELTSGKPEKGRIARKIEAASALMAVITSSDDNIRGGLYDEGRGAVVSVDFLLALLGEGMVFLNQPEFAITASQIDILLKAIEDLQAVGPRVYSACTEFLQTVVASRQGLKGSSPTDMLRKSTSNVSGTSSFSMVGSSMLASQLKQSMSSSGVLVKGNIKRGWDWRHGISAGTSGDDLLRILRLGLAQSLAKAWLMEADNRM